MVWNNYPSFQVLLCGRSFNDQNPEKYFRMDSRYIAKTIQNEIAFRLTLILNNCNTNGRDNRKDIQAKQAA